jgi:hypothetical protein
MTFAARMLGGGGTLVQLPATISRNSTKVNPIQASAGMRLHSDGTIDATPNDISALSYSDDLGLWLASGLASDYEANMSTGTPDPFSGATQGSWLGLGTTREWYTQTSSGIQDSVGTLTIRDVATQTPQASCVVTMYVESTP